MTQKTFDKLVAKTFDKRITELLEQIQRLKQYEEKGYRYVRVWRKAHKVSGYRIGGHHAHVLKKAA